MSYAIGQRVRITDPGAVIDHNLVIVIRDLAPPAYPGGPAWLVYRNEHGDRVWIDPERVAPTHMHTTQDIKQLPLFGDS